MSASLTATDIERVRQAVTDVVAARGPDHVLGRVVREAAHLCGTPLAAITMRAGGRDRLDLISVFGTGGVIVEQPLPVAHSLNGDVITSGRSFRSSDVWRDVGVSVSDIARRNRVRSLLIAPLPIRGAVAGTIALARRAPSHFSARDEAVLQEFARSVSIPLERVWARAIARCLSPFAQGDHRQANLRGLRSQPGSESPFVDQPPPAAQHHLTPRERDILGLLLADHTCRQIASVLGLSQRTVEHYLDRLKLRFGKVTLHGLATLVLADRLLE